MNFLAHALLATAGHVAEPRQRAGLIAGGVLGDWIKGPLHGAAARALPEALWRGVALHRAIDRFTDEHPAHRASRTRIAPARRRWSGVLIDIYYDHLLARHWAAHSPEALPIFAQQVYAALGAFASAYPETAATAVDWMRREDWLSSYAQRDGIADVLARMGRRARQPNPLAEGMLDLLAYEDGFLADFAAFWPEAMAFSARWIATEASVDGG